MKWNGMLYWPESVTNCTIIYNVLARGAGWHVVREWSEHHTFSPGAKHVVFIGGPDQRRHKYANVM